MGFGLIQVFGVLFLVFAASRIYLRYRDKKLSTISAVIWGGLWIALAYFLIFPGNSDFIADMLGISDGAGMIVYASIVIIYYLIFKIHVRIEQVNENITKVVHKLALKGKDE